MDSFGNGGRVLRVAALYDIHANLPAFDAVLEEVLRAGVDRVVIGGDVLPGPMPRETLSRLRELDVPTEFIRGNGDREVLARWSGTETEWYRTAPDLWREPVRWCAEQIIPEHVRWLAGWPPTRRLTVDGIGEVLFCHATPRSDTEVFTRTTVAERLRPLFEGVGVPVVVCGHTHMQFDRAVGRVRVVNAGSVGMPYGKPGAYWLLLGPGVELRRTQYDFAAAAESIYRTTYPQAAQFAAQSILQPLSEESVLASFARVEIPAEPVYGLESQ
jgi:predicted phosphodiesterase